MNRVIWTDAVDPWRNLAVEEYLLDTIRVPTLYLWRNDRTVVIGRHQNAWVECNLGELERIGGKLARRLSGGGAVYHDIHNLNFTFLMPREMYDRARQTAVLLRAVQACGIQAEASGRNDLLADGRKFSGHAFCFREGTAYHHGTLMLDTDVETMVRVLQVDAAKLASKAIRSVRSRVVNLRELKPDLTQETVRDAVTEAFCREYGEAAFETAEALPAEPVEALREKYASWDWRFGETPAFDARMKTRFPWGGVEVQLTLRDARIAQARVYTDALDTGLAEAAAERLRGAAYDPASIRQAFSGDGEELRALGEWLAGETAG